MRFKIGFIILLFASLTSYSFSQRTGGGGRGGGAGSAVVAQAGGDLLCAMAADSTIHPVTLTGVSSTASTLVYTMAAVPVDFYVGQIVQTQGNTTTGYNLAPLTIASVTSTTVTINNSSNPGAGTAGGTMSLYCSNQTNDDLTGTRDYFANTSPSVTWSAGKTARAGAHVTFYTPSANPAGIFIGMWQSPGGAGLATMTGSYNVPTASLNTGRSAYLEYDILGNSATSVSVAGSSLWWPTSASSNSLTNGISQPQTVSASALPIVYGAFYNATGVASGTYTSGITATGSTGQTCTLTSFNDSSTATATVALTGTNTIAGGTALVITNRGAAATAAPTSATAGNGTATCSGTATISTVLGGSPGNALLLRSFIWRPY